ncbi:MAG TPA: transcriptional regulator NrdR [Candidatus Nanoarchaeia archaeon]|nr:transcriptional regulator NrdR [Candidatus Nanoarchaeia archaeon]
MNCPFCGDTKSKVTNKREAPEGTRRRRECLNCSKRFTTYEKVAQADIYVIKKNETREKFDIEKIKRGLDRAFEKRPVPKDKIDKISQEIEEHIRKTGKKEIKSQKIGTLMMKKIKKLDKVAYVRFASVYREFEDLKDFKEELEGL